MRFLKMSVKFGEHQTLNEHHSTNKQKYSQQHVERSIFLLIESLHNSEKINRIQKSRLSHNRNKSVFREKNNKHVE